jgi:hypothetical protein
MPRKKTEPKPKVTEELEELSVDESDIDESKEPEACSDINEGIPVNPLPTKGLPELKGGTEQEREEKTPYKKKRDGMEKALEILDEYYKDTPKRDQRFHHDEE